MIRNVSLTTTAVDNTAETTASLSQRKISEYKIGHTTYIVETRFNSDGERLDDVIKRLILRKLSA